MKSSYELAMERLNKQHGKVAALTDKQKATLAEIEQRSRAKVAETEILYRDRIKDAGASGKFDEIAKLDAEMKMEITRIRDRAESEKDSVRRDASLA